MRGTFPLMPNPWKSDGDLREERMLKAVAAMVATTRHGPYTTFHNGNVIGGGSAESDEDYISRLIGVGRKAMDP